MAAAAVIEAVPGFNEIVRRQQSMVFGIAYHFLQDRALAEELAQEVFLQLYQHLDEMESAAHVTYWLRRVTGNRCIDYARKRKLRPKIGLDEVPEPSTQPTFGDPLLRQALNRLVASLPEKQRMVMIMRYQEDLDPAEIAETLAMPVRTVKSHLQRSLAMLRTKLARAIGVENV